MDRQGAPLCIAVLLAVLGLCMGAANAFALVPQGNLLKNGDAETGNQTGFYATDTVSVVNPDYWTVGAASGESPSVTAIRYGTPGVAGVDVSAAIGGGLNFFAGGPGTALDYMSQRVYLPDATSEIDRGTVSITISGYLGGFGSEPDNALLSAFFYDSGGLQQSGIEAPIVYNTDRQNLTKLQLVSATGVVPPGTRSIGVRVLFTRGLGGSYDDAYADNLGLFLAAPGGPGGTPPPSGGVGGGSVQADKTAATISFAGGGSAQRIGAERAVIVKVNSNEAAALSASGTLSVPGASKVFKLGKAVETVGPGQSKKLKLKISRKTARSVKRALKRHRKVRANVTVVAVDTAGNQSTIKRKIKAKR
jgi:hypothetical protein